MLSMCREERASIMKSELVTRADGFTYYSITMTPEEDEAERLSTIYQQFDDFADSDEARMGLVELIEACGGTIPFDICTSCGSDEARYTSHYNNNSECQS